MLSKLEEVLNEMGLEYYRQGSYASDEEYKGSFFTYWNFDTPEDAHYDNEANRSIWFWQVYYYTNNPSTLYSKMDEFIEKAKAKGFIIEGRGRDIDSDDPNYIGRMITIKYMEEY